MSLEGQEAGTGITPIGVKDETVTLREGPVDVETGLPKFTITETRAFSHKFGEPPVHTRRFRSVQEIFDGTSTSRADVASYVEAYKGASHPTYPGLVCTETSMVETTESSQSSLKLITEIEAVYTVPPDEDEDDPGAHPLSKSDTWTFQTQGASVAALYYIDANNDIKPLTNSAGDYIKGLEVDEAQTKVIIKGNRPFFPSSLATSLTNCVNSNTFLGGTQDHWKCQGISGELKYEVWNDTFVRYWEVTVELLYRQTGWNLLIPDVGFTFIAAGEKKRAMVFDDENKQWVASAEPIALDGNGGQVAAGNPPAVLNRRLYARVDFSTYFGSPPA